MDQYGYIRHDHHEDIELIATTLRAGEPAWFHFDLQDGATSYEMLITPPAHLLTPRPLIHPWSGRHVVGVYRLGVHHFDLTKIVHASYVSNKLGVAPSGGQAIAELLNAVSAEMGVLVSA